jgi:4-amino-4-deoxy-L-arabinose transferase-like glycosyltransferase
MSLSTRRAAALFSRMVYAVFLALFALLALEIFLHGSLSELGLICLLCLLGLLLGLPVLMWAGRRATRLGPGKALLLLLLLCFVVKLAWVLWARIPPESDYRTFYTAARQLSEQPVLQHPRYLALFPHLMGYAWFLSVFFRLFGSSEFLPVLLNVFLSTLSAAALFHLGRRLAGLEVATATTLLWIACPSQTIYNMFVLSEPLYTALILLFFCVVVEAAARKSSPPLRIGAGILGGLLLTGIQAVRPVAVILFLGLMLWLLLLQMDAWREKKFRIRWLSFFIALLVCWGAAGNLWDHYLSLRLGEEPASVPGYNILVGLNPDSSGSWNEEDSAQLNFYSTQPGSTPQGVQEHLLDSAKERIRSGAVDFPRLFWEKLYIFLGNDAACVQYAQSMFSHSEFLRRLCNAFYYSVLLLSFFGALSLFQKGDRSLLFLPMVYVLGLTIAQMLVEVAGRYHYSILPSLCLLGALGGRWLTGLFWGSAYVRTTGSY